jgi:hypothetical protein
MRARSHARPVCHHSLGSRGSDCETALPLASISNSLWLVVCYEAGVGAFDQATNLAASGKPRIAGDGPEREALESAVRAYKRAPSVRWQFYPVSRGTFRAHSNSVTQYEFTDAQLD